MSHFVLPQARWGANHPIGAAGREGVPGGPHQTAAGECRGHPARGERPFLGAARAQPDFYTKGQALAYVAPQGRPCWTRKCWWEVVDKGLERGACCVFAAQGRRGTDNCVSITWAVRKADNCVFATRTVTRGCGRTPPPPAAVPLPFQGRSLLPHSCWVFNCVVSRGTHCGVAVTGQQRPHPPLKGEGDRRSRWRGSAAT